jgi:hypothetical protein
MREWTIAVLRCEDLALPETFLRTAGSVAGVFPWLPAWVESLLSPR